MSEVDYGYGEQLDYGYGEDCSAQEQQAPAMMNVDVYGYGNENDAPIHEAKNLHNNIMNNNDNNGGDCDATLTHVRRGPKRRCSVTKFSLENDDDDGSGTHQPTLLTAASVIQNIRNGTYTTTVAADAFPTTNTTDVNMNRTDDPRMVPEPPNQTDVCATDAGRDYMDDDFHLKTDDCDLDNNNIKDDLAALSPSTAGTKVKRNSVFRLLSLKRF